MRAHLLGYLNRRKVYRFPVQVSINDGAWPGAADITASRGGVVWVTSRNMHEALDHVYDLLAPHVGSPTEFCVYGPRGGTKERFIGWHTLVTIAMDTVARKYFAKQLELPWGKQ